MKRDTQEARNALARVVGDAEGAAQLHRILARAKALHVASREAVHQAHRTEGALRAFLRGGQHRAPVEP